MTTDTADNTAQRDYKADPPKLRAGVHYFATVVVDRAECLVAVRKVAGQTTPRLGMPGGSMGPFDGADPAWTLWQHLEKRLGVRTSATPALIGVDWVPEDRYCPGINFVFDGGVITPQEFELMRPTEHSGYGEITAVPISQLDTAGFDPAELARIRSALNVRKSGHGFPLTVKGVPLLALAD